MYSSRYFVVVAVGFWVDGALCVRKVQPVHACYHNHLVGGTTGRFP